jgi:hypothetical protein
MVENENQGDFPNNDGGMKPFEDYADEIGKKDVEFVANIGLGSEDMKIGFPIKSLSRSINISGSERTVVLFPPRLEGPAREIQAFGDKIIQVKSNGMVFYGVSPEKRLEIAEKDADDNLSIELEALIIDEDRLSYAPAEPSLLNNRDATELEVDVYEYPTKEV